ncbi:MAG: PDZ domain-containing protein, partial [Verrucomicrobiota bacterium]|nr:PDZ domain-containing protein [Verrucomicrobiota bacterium]
KRALRYKTAGDSVQIGLMRDGKPKEIQFETGAFPEEFTAVARTRRIEEKGSQEPLQAELFGMKVQEISEDLAERFKISEKEGVIVVSVEKGSVSEEKNISPGDVVTRINSTEISSIESFNKSIENEDLKKGVLVHIKSNGSQRFEVLKDY